MMRGLVDNPSDNTKKVRLHVLNPLLELARVENCLLVSGFTLAGFLIQGLDTVRIADVLLAMACMCFACAFGNAINDYCDRWIDKKNKPHRPIPSGRLRPELAQAFAAFAAAASIILALTTSTPTTFATFIVTVLFALALYSTWLKNASKISGNILISIIVASPLFVSSVILKNAPSTAHLGLGMCAVLATLAREITKDASENGSENGTLAKLVGKKKALQTASILLLTSILVSAVTNDWTTSQGTGRTVLLLVAYAVLSAGAFFLAAGDSKGQTRVIKAGMLLAILAYFF